MRITSVFLALLFGFAYVGGEGDDSVQRLVKKLGSSNFQERQAATQELQERPDAAPLLREALRSPDREVRKRAAEILDYFDRRPLRELYLAIKDGRIDQVAKKLAAWPKGIYEEEVWSAVQELAQNLADRHQKQGGKKFIPLRTWGPLVPDVIVDKRVCESTDAHVDRRHFVRAVQIDLDSRRRKPGDPKNELSSSAVMVSDGAVRIQSGEAHFILAGGDVELDGYGSGEAIIISGGDITLRCSMVACLIIARGKITCTGREYENNRIISGKRIAPALKDKSNLVTENEPNPLGFIRWSDAPKDKPAPKQK